MFRRFSVADVVIEVVQIDGHLDRAVDSMFGACPSATGEPTISIEISSTPLTVPDRPADGSINGVQRWHTSDGVVTRHSSGASGQRRGSGVIVWMPPRLGDADRAFRLALQYPLVDALSLQGRYPIHAAVLVADGHAMLAAGPTGAGKSTFAAAALRSGWLAFGDDLAFVGHGANGEVRVWALPKSLNIPADAMEHIPSDAQQISDDARDRWRLPAAGRLSSGSARLAGIVILDHSDGAASSMRLSDSPALLKQFALSLGIGRLSGDVREIFRLSGAMARLPVYEYLHDREPAQRAAAVDDFLATVGPSITGSERAPSDVAERRVQ